MRTLLFALAAVLACAAPAAAADGAKLFALQCKSCHGAKSTPMGPTLSGVFGAKIAGRSDYAYSKGLKAKTGTWSAENLDAYLAKPAGFAPGTRMLTAVPDAASRAALVDYVRTLK
ncbi:MAG: c-type cytochrome [Phenylobacterium sp.]|uniref:c-type cytochrome n=1 Tax=Phenylobacterium sp. TaxID=1871053 RepID=UPI00391A8BE8